MTDEARKALNAYRREWYKKNPGKRREYMTRYWERKAAQGQSDRQKPAEIAEKQGGESN